jgi:DNA-binding transcriptional ArsR family regulator
MAFTIVHLLTENKEMSPSEIAKAAGRSVPRVSNILAALRLAEVVRDETEGKWTRYRINHPREVRKVLEALAGFVKGASAVRR